MVLALVEVFSPNNLYMLQNDNKGTKRQDWGPLSNGGIRKGSVSLHMQILT